MIRQTQYCRDGSIGIIYRKSISHLTESKNVSTTEGGKHNISAFRRKNNFLDINNLIIVNKIMVIFIRKFKWGNYLNSLNDVRNEISSLEVGHNNVIDTDRLSFNPKDTKDREKYSPGSWRRPRKVKRVSL